MTDLTALLHRWAEQSAGIIAWSWAGSKPESERSLVASIMEKIGLDARGREHDFTTISAADAAIWLALFATKSLLHGGISTDVQNEIELASAALDSNYTFLTKGEWKYSRKSKHYERVGFDSGWNRRRHRLFFSTDSEPIPPIDVIVDGGMIGFNTDRAFVFWVAEDD